MEERKSADVELNNLPLENFSYLKQTNCVCKNSCTIDLSATDFFALYRIEKITFEKESPNGKEAPKKEALENVITSMSLPGANLLYIILGDRNKVEFYFGVAKDFSLGKQQMEISDVGSNIMKPALQGNFRGSSIKELDGNEKKAVLDRLDSMKRIKLLEGVPSVNKDDDKFQTVNRLVDIMFGDIFALLVIAKPLNLKDISNIRKGIFATYDLLSVKAKYTQQIGGGKNESVTEGTNKGESETKGKSSSISKTFGTSSSEQTGESESKTTGENTGWSKSKGKSESKQEGTSSGTAEQKGGSDSTTTGDNDGSKTSSHALGTSWSNSSNEGKSSSVSKGSSTTDGESGGKSKSDTKGTSTSTTKGKSESKAESSGQSESKAVSSGESKSKTVGTNSSESVSKEVVNKNIQDWLKYIDEILLPRLDYSAGKGNFVVSVAMLGEKNAQVFTLENAIRSIYSGEKGNRVPLQAMDLDENESSFLRRFQIPVLEYKSDIANELINFNITSSQFVTSDKRICLGNWMSSKELGLLCGLPQKEVIGLALSEEIEYGLSIPPKQTSDVMLGHLVESGVPLDGKNGLAKIEVGFNPENFDRHIFVTGVTGAGKTTTCQKLLLGANTDGFLVIEPAKTEYRILQKTKFPDMLVFTLGNEQGLPFRLNPFEFFKGENIVSRIDMIKASMEASFEMEAAIPQLLEASLNRAYKNKGWNVDSNEWTKDGDPYEDASLNAFPTLSDVIAVLPEVVQEQGFDERLRDEYLGSLRARLQSLTIGSKGLMLDVPHSINFIELLDKKVVFELEEIKSGSEKSLVMGFILSNLNEAIRFKYEKLNSVLKDGEKEKKVSHITLIEEAHRLLSKYDYGDSKNKKQGVEMFSDMLAEVRKYGECLIIADQIPNKLTPEVLKNTNTKLVHTLFAEDDKKAIANIMALKDNQKNHISYLPPGRVVLTMPKLEKAILVQIEKTEENDTGRHPPRNEELQEALYEFYADNYKTGIISPLDCLDKKPSAKAVGMYFKHLKGKSLFWEYFADVSKNYEKSKDFAKFVEICKELNSVSDYSYENLALVIFRHFVTGKIDCEADIKEALKLLVKACVENKKFDFQKYDDLMNQIAH